MKLALAPEFDPVETRDPLAFAKSYIPKLRAGQVESDRQARVPEAMAEEMQAAGLFSLTVPRAYGGLETSLTEWMEINAEVGRGNGGVAWAMTLINACNWTVATLYPRHVVDEVFADPDTRVAGVFSPRSVKARAAEGGIFIERGTWVFNSGVSLAQWDLLGVPLFNEKGEMSGRGIALLPISDVNVLNDWDTIGLRGSGSSTVTVENVFIPNERLVNMEDALACRYHGAFGDSPIFRCAFVPLTAIVLCFPVVGLGQHMLEEVLEKLPSRGIPYSAYTKQGEATVTHLQVGQAAAKIEAAKMMVAKACAEIDHFAEAGETMPYMDRARARLYTGAADQMMWEAVDMLASAGGGSLARRSNLLNHIWQDVRVASMHGIAAPMSNFELYGRLLCGMDSNQMMV